MSKEGLEEKKFFWNIKINEKVCIVISSIMMRRIGVQILKTREKTGNN